MTTTELVNRSPVTVTVTADDLPILADQIKAAHAAVGTALQHAVEAGRLLIQAKRLVQRGIWLPWLANNCDLSERTAQLYMKLAREAYVLADKNEIRNGVADLSVRKAAKAIAKPSARDTTEIVAITNAPATVDVPVPGDDVERSAELRKAEAAQKGDETEDEDRVGFVLAVIRNAAEKKTIAVRNFSSDFTNDDRVKIAAAIDSMIREWESAKRKLGVKAAPRSAAHEPAAAATSAAPPADPRQIDIEEFIAARPTTAAALANDVDPATGIPKCFKREVAS